MGNYSQTGYSFGGSFVTGKRTDITTTRVRDDISTSLTNIDTKSDAWGKVIPMGFGRHRVAGALVWASQFYKTTESFDDVTTKQSVVTWFNTDHIATFVNGLPLEDKVVNSTQDVVQSSGSQVTHGTETNAFIDLCYSFGTEGDTRRKRYIEKIRINDTIVYDTTQNYIADGIGFSIRYGYDNAAPALLEKYPNGKFHYKGQTLVIFDRFPLNMFGDSVPQSVDVEFGCCAAPPQDPDNLDIHDSGWPLRFWVQEWGSQYLEDPFKLAISGDTVQDGGAIGWHLNPNWTLGPDVYVTGTAIVTGGDPRFTSDLNPVKVLDNIHTTQGGGPNGSVWRFSRTMTREEFIAYQQAGGIPFFAGNGVARTGANADAHNENYFEQNTVAYSIWGFTSGKPGIKIKDRLINDTVDTKNTVSLQSYKGKGRTLYVTPLFRTNRGTYSIWVTLTNADGDSWPSFWNGGFTNGRAGGSHTEFLSRGDGAPYYIGKPGEMFTYAIDPNIIPQVGGSVTGIAVTVNHYVYFNNVYTSE